MTMKRTQLNRRTVLRGLVGGSLAVVGLPTLEAMLNSNGTALAGGGGLPLRMMTWFFGNGVKLARWVPTALGPNYPLSEELAPLAGVREYVSVLTNFDNRCEELITHHEGMTLFNGVTMTDVSGLFSKAGGPTVDQIAADTLGAGAPIRSVQVGVSKKLSIMDSGTTMHNLSHAWAGPLDNGQDVPLPPEYNPQKVWDTLFGSFVPKDDPSKPVRLSVLDAVRTDTARLRKRLGKSDNLRLDAHLQGVRELEKKINAIAPVCETPERPTFTNADVNGAEEIVTANEIMSELLRYAFTCDVTRVASVLFAGGAGETIFSDLGHSTVHHDDTHNNFSSAQERVHDGVVYTMERLAYLLQTFKDTPDGVSGNLLDSCAILIGSDCSEGYSHSVKNQAVLVAGKARGALVHPGVHFDGGKGNTTDITLAVLKAVAPQVTEIGRGAPYSNTPCAAIYNGT
jgi:hypothetical protein